MPKKPVKKAELFILFGVMSPAEISKLFPEYKSCVRQYHMEYKQAQKAVMAKLTIKSMAKRVFFGSANA